MKGAGCMGGGGETRRGTREECFVLAAVSKVAADCGRGISEDMREGERRQMLSWVRVLGMCSGAGIC